MSTVRICECMAEENFPVCLAPGLDAGAPCDHLQCSAISRSAFRGSITSLISAVGFCGSTVIRAAADPRLRPSIWSRSRATWRVAPTAILPTFVEWSEIGVVDDLIGAILPVELVTAAKKEELSEMYRRSVWTEILITNILRLLGSLLYRSGGLLLTKGIRRTTMFERG